eukprot:6464263-Amphidinium_carterae.1
MERFSGISHVRSRAGISRPISRTVLGSCSCQHRKGSENPGNMSVGFFSIVFLAKTPSWHGHRNPNFNDMEQRDSIA